MTRLQSIHLPGTALAIVLSASPTLAQAEAASGGPYIQFGGGLLSPLAGEGETRTPAPAPSRRGTSTPFEVEYKQGSTYGLSLGYAYGPTRVELAIDRLRGDIDAAMTATLGQSLEIDTAMVNVWFPLRNGKLRPYLGGGVGMARKSLDRYSDEGSAAQVGLGLDWRLGDHFTIDARYRYLATERMEYQVDGSTVSFDYESQLLTLGLRYTFFNPSPAQPEKPVTVVPPIPAAACGDGVDNDRDGVLDFPDDPGCITADDDDELDAEEQPVQPANSSKGTSGQPLDAGNAPAELPPAEAGQQATPPQCPDTQNGVSTDKACPEIDDIDAILSL